MEPVLKSLTLVRFRSLPGETIHFDNPTILVGRNGSGKSNLTDAISFLADAMAVPLQAVFDRRGGIAAVRNKSSSRSHPPNFGIAAEFGKLTTTVEGAHYAFEVKAQPSHGFKVVRERCIVKTTAGTAYFDRKLADFDSNVKGLSPVIEPSALALPLVGGETRFSSVVQALAGMRVYSIQPSALREMQDPDSGQILRKDGANAASVLQEIQRQSPDDFLRIPEFLGSIVPNTNKVRAVKHGNKLSFEFTQEWGEKKSIRFEAFGMSDGTLRALGMLTAVFQIPTPTLIVLEEPESTMHPGAFGAVMDLIRHASRITQVVVTTHSPDLLDADWLEERHLRVVQWREGSTRVTSLGAGASSALREGFQSAGELLRSNALTGQNVVGDDVPRPELFPGIEA